MNVELIFQIAGIGILTSIFHTILKQAGKEEYSFIATLAGVAIALIMVVQLLAELFVKVKGVFFLY
jgi:stage III sporulation protein AC